MVFFRDSSTKAAAALFALLNAMSGCAPSPDAKAANGDPVETAIASSALGVAITGCAASSGGAGYDGTTSTLTLNLAADTAVISAPGGKINVNGYICLGTVMAVANTQLSTANVKKLKLNGSAAANTVILDLLPGGFGTQIMSSTGGIIVDFAAAGGGSNSGADSFMIRGSAGIENLKYAKTAAGDVYIEMSGDKNADVKITAPIGTGTLALTASLGAGADILTGSPVTGMMADITGFPSATATPTAITTLVMTNAITAYGGAGADTFTGGTGNDAFYGGDDNDLFKMAAVTDGADIYQGDNGVDTVDYSTRVGGSDAQNIDIGPVNPAVTGTVDLATLDFSVAGPLDGKTLIFSVDGGGDVTTTFDTSMQTDPAGLVAAINTAAAATVASLNGVNQLTMMTPTAWTSGGSASMEIKAASDLETVFGLSTTAATTTADADDGLAGENDDVRSSTENITGGSGNDIIVGDSAKNIIHGGPGNDTLAGGGNTTCTDATFGDSLLGEAGDDTIYVPVKNCWAVITGAAGADAVNYSGRSAALTLSNDGMAVDGDPTGTSERGNISADTESIIGGFGADTITGGMGADILVGGAGVDTIRGGAGDDSISGGAGNDVLSGEDGNDVIIGGAGNDVINGGLGTDDIVDYSSYAMGEPVTVTLCVAPMTLFGAPTTATEAGATTCPAGNDGYATNETDQVLNIEHVKGGAGADHMTASAFGTVGVTFEGNAGGDTLTGGPNGDVLWGDAGDDFLYGMGGDDTLDGVAGDDLLDGGAGDGDICVPDAADTTAAPVACEL